jgi:hypothetical protein
MLANGLSYIRKMIYQLIQTYCGKIIEDDGDIFSYDHNIVLYCIFYAIILYFLRYYIVFFTLLYCIFVFRSSDIEPNRTTILYESIVMLN